MSELPTKFRKNNSSDWCDICDFDGSITTCKECSAYRGDPCSQIEEWQAFPLELSPKEYIELLFHKCLRCNRMHTRFNEDQLEVQQIVDYRFCQPQPRDDEEE